MDYSLTGKIITNLIVVGVVLFAVIRFAEATNATQEPQSPPLATLRTR